MRFASFPRFPLLAGPTPLQRAERLEKALGANSPRIFIKRDDLTGLAYGGNKTRKLEYLVAEAITQQATVLVTAGAVQSNHARQTAAAAVLAGMKSHLILDARYGHLKGGNLLIDQLLGAEIVFVDGDEERVAYTAKVPELLAEQGERAYMIPIGGSTPLGSLGYVRAAHELNTQLIELGVDADVLYYTSGSQGTAAGLIAGSMVFNTSWNALGIGITSDEEHLRAAAAPLTQATLDLMEAGLTLDPESIPIDDSFVGDGYGISTEASVAALRLVAQTEAILLDPVYTSKPMAALIAHVREGRYTPDQSVVFLHSGGAPAIFVHEETLLEGS